MCMSYPDFSPAIPFPNPLHLFYSLVLAVSATVISLVTTLAWFPIYKFHKYILLAAVCSSECAVVNSQSKFPSFISKLSDLTYICSYMPHIFPLEVYLCLCGMPLFYSISCILPLFSFMFIPLLISPFPHLLQFLSSRHS